VPEKDRLYGWTLISTNEFTENAIMSELRNKHTDVILNPMGVPYPTKHQESWKYRVLKPFYQIAEIFMGLHKGGTLSNIDYLTAFMWVVYASGVFLLIELFRIIS
jgi:hypothetical protein